MACWGPHYSALATGGALAPVVQQGLSDVTHVAVGDLHTCAVENGASMSCWGFGAYGQLGNGFLDNTAEPTPGKWPWSN